MRVQSMGNDDQESSHVSVRQYCKISNKGVYKNCDRSKAEGNKHSYFLRAKTPRFVGFHGSPYEDGELKKPSMSPPFCRPFSSSSSRGSKFEHCDEDQNMNASEEEDLANCLVMLSNKSCDESKGRDVNLEKGMFQCKACKKVFNSHQALGGHRASHKKVKGCFASKLDGLNDDDEDEGSIQEDQEAPPLQESDAVRPATARKRAKMHECSVCRRVFSSGQALGGHKRCHWLTTSSDNAFIPNFQDFKYDHRSQQLCNKKPVFTKACHDRDGDHNRHDHGHDPQLDLNLNLPPAPRYDHLRNDLVASTRLCMQEWANQNQHKEEKSGEEGYGMKLRQLSDLRDLSLDGGWLQMGIASTTEMR